MAHRCRKAALNLWTSAHVQMWRSVEAIRRSVTETEAAACLQLASACVLQRPLTHRSDSRMWIHTPVLHAAQQLYVYSTQCDSDFAAASCTPTRCKMPGFVLRRQCGQVSCAIIPCRLLRLPITALRNSPFLAGYPEAYALALGDQYRNCVGCVRAGSTQQQLLASWPRVPPSREHRQHQAAVASPPSLDSASTRLLVRFILEPRG